MSVGSVKKIVELLHIETNSSVPHKYANLQG